MTKNKRGSMLIGVIIVFMMISSLAVAIISRSLQGTILATDSKKGYVTYQGSDSSVESFLDKLKQLDLGIYNNNNKTIPENVNVSDFCVGFSCYGKDALTLLGESKKVSDIFNFQYQNIGSLIRAIQAPFPDRVFNNASLDVQKCEGSNCQLPYNTYDYNNCDINVKVNASEDDTIANYEVRTSNDSEGSLTNPIISDTQYGWQRIVKDSQNNYFLGEDSTIFKNGTDQAWKNTGVDFWYSLGDSSGGQYGQTYYFTVKARHKNPFSLDSLYLDDGSGNASKSVKINDSPNCDGTVSIGNVDYKALSKLGCVSTLNQPVGTETFGAAYNCCNGTECYMPSPHWIDDPEKKCALEKCDDTDRENYKDNVANNVNGDLNGLNGLYSLGTGWCGLSVSCKPSTSCLHPYRTVGYCTTAPSSSSQNTIFLPSTSWTLNNYTEVDVNNTVVNKKYSETSTKEPRCAYHDCPVSPLQACGSPTNGHGSFSASLSSCTKANCGPYTASVSCNLTCDSGYYPAESKPRSSDNSVNVTYSNSCCYQNAPTPTPTCSSLGYDCGGSPVWIPKCGGGDWTQGSCYNMQDCSGNPICSCGFTGTCTKTCNGPVDTRSCNPTYNISSCSCGGDICTGICKPDPYISITCNTGKYAVASCNGGYCVSN